MRQIHSTQLATAKVPGEASSASIQPMMEFTVLGLLVTFALSTFLYQQHRRWTLRRRTRTLERMWQLDMTEKAQ